MGAAMSDLEFRFVPVNDAATLKIIAVDPPGFSFQQSTVQVPLNIDARTSFNKIIINHVPIMEGLAVVVKVKDVLLGEGGGQTKFDITTFLDKIPPTGEQDAIKRDEKLSYEGGFRLPGKVDVISRKLDSLYSIMPQRYPVKSFINVFSPRVEERAKAEFEISFTRQTMAGSYLEVSNEGITAYALDDEGFMVQGPSGAEIPSLARLSGIHKVRAQMRPNMPATEIAFQAFVKYRIIIFTIPIAGMQNSWRFETTDGGMYPSNTNDADIGSFSPVESMALTVKVPRSPPGAIVDVALNIVAGNAVIRQLMIIAPRDFIFPSSGCGEMCQPSTMFEDTEQMTAQIASPTGEPLTKLETTRVKVQTPQMTPPSTTWFVIGKTTGGLSTVGWGEANGFPINQMANTPPSPMIMYPAVAGLKGSQITFKFTLDIAGGRSISVEPPFGYLLTCSTEGALMPLSLPGRKPDCVDEPLELILSETLKEGEYAFALDVDIPPEEPNPNTFNIIIKDGDGLVLDASFNTYGRALRNDIDVHSPVLKYSITEPGQQAIIIFGFTIGTTESKLRSILLKFPKKFIHDVMRPTDVMNLNKDMRVAAGTEWMDVSSYTDRLLIKLDDTDPDLIVPPGDYTFRFPAMVPCCYQADMPRNNVWYMSLCYDQQCAEPDDRSVLITFSMAGFNLNDPPTTSGRIGASTARRKSELPVWWTSILGLLVASSCMCLL